MSKRSKPAPSEPATSSGSVATRAPRAPRVFARRSFRERAAARDGRVDVLVFRVGRERFATDLSAVEEAVDQIEVQSIPDMPTAMLGVFALRDRMLAVYAPEPALRVPLDRTDVAAIIIRTPFRRVGIAVDDIADVVELDLTTLRAAPGTEDSDGVLLGIMWRGADLISVVDADALVASCIADTSLETA